MDRIACAWIPRFELLAQAGGVDVAAPCALVDLARGAARIRAASPAAERRGVAPGELARAARARCPELVLVPPDPAALAAAERAVLAALATCSPLLDADGRGGFFLGLDGLGRLAPDEGALAARIRAAVVALGYPAQVAIAPSAFVAWIAAMRRVGPDGIVRIATGADAAALAEIPLEALELGERPLALLGLLGLRTVGQIARLPPGALADRLGPEGARLERLVRQEGPFALPTTARLPVEREEAGLELDGPVDDPEVLLFVIKSLLDRLLAGLRRTHQGLIELAIVLALDDRTEHRHAVVPAEPTLDGAALLDLIRLWLGGAPLAAPVVGLRLVAARHGAIPARQLDLLRQREEREAAALERAIARLGAAFGGGALVRPRLVETYRPEARVGWERVDARALAAAATLAPPAADADAPAPVVLRMGPPERLWWDERGVRRAGEGSRRVVERDGPRRLAGDGWDAAYDRSYWWIGLDDGARWWVFRDELDGGWWLHGIAD